MRNDYNSQVSLIKRPGVRGKEISLVPEPADKLRADDKLIVVGPEKAVERVKLL